MESNLKLVLSALFLLNVGLEKPVLAGGGHSSFTYYGEGKRPERTEWSDGTLSNPQPDSHYWGLIPDGEGFCGQTAAANVIQMLKGDIVTVEDAARECTDSTPGTLPSTLRTYLKKKTSLNWKIGNPAKGGAALAKLIDAVYRSHAKARGTNITPIPVHVTGDDGKGGHWVTVVGVDTVEKKVTFNQWGWQYTQDLDSFLNRWNSGYVGPGGAIVGARTMIYPES